MHMMKPVTDDTLSVAIAATVRSARMSAGLSVAGLADRSGVSRAMISRVETGAARPTAVLLGRLSGALGLSLSQLLARAESNPPRIARRLDQPTWIDPGTGYLRRAVSPVSGGPVELVEVELPAGTEIDFPAESYAFLDHQIWVLEGRLTFREGQQEHELGPGDCLHLGAPQPCTYRNDTDRACRYLVALGRTGAVGGRTATASAPESADVPAGGGFGPAPCAEYS